MAKLLFSNTSIFSVQKVHVLEKKRDFEEYPKFWKCSNMIKILYLSGSKVEGGRDVSVTLNPLIIQVV